jgi:hypothetical protein
MRGVQVQVPDQAKQRLDELVIARDLALDQTRTLQARINQSDGAEDLFRLRLTAERDRHEHRHATLARLVSSCNQFLMQLRLAPGTALEVHPPLDLSIKTSLPRAVEATRTRIADLQQEIARTRALPIKHASRQEAIDRYLNRLSLCFAPKVGFDVHGNARVIWNEEIVHSKDDVLGLLHWLAPATVSKAFAELLAAEPEPEEAISPAERDQQLGRFADTLLVLERQEEHLVSFAATSEGIEILRRHDAAPMAVLNLVIVRQEAEAKVA